MGPVGSFRLTEGNQKKRGCWWLVVILLLLGLGSVHYGVCACSPRESEVLLSLKGNDSSTSEMKSWKRGSDCCNGWEGVICDPRTQDVVSLYLPYTDGQIGSSLAHLCNLNMLQSLSIGMENKYSGSIVFGGIPACLWNMTELESLFLGVRSGSLSADLCNLDMLQELHIKFIDFARAREIPACLWNMTELEALSLEGTRDLALPVASPVGVRGLQELMLSNTGIRGALPSWIGNLSQLYYLEVNSNNITALSSLPMSLKTLHAADNIITEIPSSIGEFGSSLEGIYLSGNSIINIRANVLSNLSRLDTLDLSHNQITAFPLSLACVNLNDLHLERNRISEVSGSLDQLPILRLLDLASNLLTQLPASLGNLSRLAILWLQDNRIIEWPASLGRLSSMITLDLSSNNLSTFDVATTSNFSNLIVLDLSHNNLSRDIPESWSALTQLESLNLANNRLTGQLPEFLYSETSQLTVLNVSRNQLSGQIQEFRWAWSLRVRREGILYPDVSYDDPESFNVLDLSSNNFTGPLPSFALAMFEILLLSNNSFSGSIPLGLANSIHLKALDVSFNQLSGGLPEILGNCSNLERLHAGNNSLTGEIPSSLGKTWCTLVSLSLHDNFFEGEIPESLSNCQKLIVLDLSRNRLNGTLPSSFQNLPPSLRVFMVGSNNLTGEFPSWIVNLTSLQVLDLSNNALSGELPRSYSKLQGFIIGESTSKSDTLYDDEIQITAKGRQMELSSIVSVRTSFDVHNNQFTGSIPEKFGELQGLRYLTLSSNSFNGSIPASLSNLSHLESLYLFNNLLTGKIPPELNDISSLGFFDVSSNQLTGRIPPGPPGHISTFPISSFANNPGLCGIPLPDCPSDSVPTQAPTQPPSNGFKDGIGDWISLNGFLMGFSASFGTVSFIFALSKKARSYLCVPKRTVKRVYWYREPYGMYRPKQ